MTIHFANKQQLSAVLRILETLNLNKTIICTQVGADEFEIIIVE